MEVLTKDWTAFRRQISGNTPKGQELYSRCVRDSLKKLQDDPEYARHIWEQLDLYDENGVFRGNDLP